VGSEVLLEQVHLKFKFRNKFVILPYGPLVDNNTFSKIAFLKVVLAKLIMVVMS